MKILFFIILSLSLLNCSKTQEPEVNIITISESTTLEIPENFLSFAIDMALIVGAKWWDNEETFSSGRGGTQAQELNLENEDLINKMKVFSPSLIRIGGTEADHVFYKLNNQDTPKHFDSSLSRQRIDQIFKFLRAINSKLIFTVNAGNSVRKNGVWQEEQLKMLLQYLKIKNYNIPYFEFGNEISSFWAIHGPLSTVSSDQYENDFLVFKKLIKDHNPNSLTLGPASAFWPIIGEPGSTFFGLNDHAMKHKYPDIISWHYYPTQSKRCPLQVRNLTKDSFLKPKYLNEFKKISIKLINKMKKYKNSAPMWLGETGSAQCGGVKGVSDKVESSFWWLDQLGLAARTGQKLVIRQSIYGGDYALLNPDFTPRPDYWASYFWKQFMGTKVLMTSKKYQDESLRIYAHKSVKNKKTVLAINLSSKDKTIHLKNQKVKEQCSFVSNLEIKNQQTNLKCSKIQSENIILEKKSIYFLPLE